MTDRLTRDLLVAEISGVEDSDYARLLWRKAREEIKNLRTALVRYGDKSRMASVEPIGLQQTIDRAFLIDALNTRAEPSAQKAALSQNDLYYLRAISRRLDEFQSAMDGLDALTIGGEALADERDWIECFIDQHTRTIAEKDTPNDR